MVEFVDKSSSQSGTPLSRETLMAMQGFVATRTEFDTNASGEPQIIETNIERDERLITTFKNDGSIDEEFSGLKKITKTTTFNEDGTIEEVITNGVLDGN